MDTLHNIYNHLVLPPQLPGEQDADIEAISHEIAKRILGACDGVGSLVDQHWSRAFQCLRVSLTTCVDLNAGRLEKTTLLKHFRRLEPNHMLILHVVEQNAALIIRREICEDQDRVIFEAFEASATSEQVLAAEQVMQWDFPGRSAQLPLAVFLDPAFQDTLAGFLEQACIESLHSLQAQTRKKGVSITEARDTTSPALITQLLIPLLEAMGDHFQAPVLRKRVRDDVNITEGNLPWRRLPFWLVLRVASQRHLCLLLGNEQGRMSYKLLMCILFSELLKDSAGTLHPELTIMLRAKLCRRMAKLEIERTKTKPADRPIYDLSFAQISAVVKGTIENVTAQIDAAWSSFKKATTRNIPRLPLRAADDALRLSLPNSGNYLDRLLLFSAPQRQSLSSFDLPRPLDKTIQHMQDFTDHIYNLALKECRIRRSVDLGTGTIVGYELGDETYENQCIKLGRQINRFFEEVGTTYDSDPEQMSNMILSIFTLWVRLDKCAVRACPILADHRPVFYPETLDVLQLPTLDAMRQLQAIQDYLSERHKKSRLGTILGDINLDCLAVRYVAQSRKLKALASDIQHASDEARKAKKSEWTYSCEEYDSHTAAIANGTCCCTWRDGQRDVRGCSKCWHWRVRNRIQIRVHEAFLPVKDPQRSAIIFELAIPDHISAYRNATWRIMRALTHPDRLERSSTPAIELIGCGPLRSYFGNEAEGISLASTIKCFQQTHYKFARGKAPLSDIVLPFGASFELYDRVSGLWIKDLTEPLSFQHLCGVRIPSGLRKTVIPAVQHTATVMDGPSSYQIQANETECPADMSVHEFSACQKLLTGKLRRWPNILVELGSSNLNFSGEETTRLLCQLAVQAGPESDGEDLRAVHAVFKEPAFLERLEDIIGKRLDAISTNWREHNHMELLITLALRIVHLSSGLPRERGKIYLRKARDAILDWVVRLRRETRSAIDANAAMRTATYGFNAALLCRRTFTAHADLNWPIDPEDLASWIQASVALQENLPNDIGKLPHTMKSMLIRDTKTAHQLWPLLQSAIHAHPDSIGDGIRRSWTDSSDDIPLTFAEWNFLAQPDDFWVAARMFEGRQMSNYSQVIHCHILEGHLLVNKKPRGKLPLEIRNDAAVKEIFGDKHLLTYPSSLPGMSHRLTTDMFGQWVHFGLRDGRVVIRIVSRDDLLEYVPRDIFVGPGRDNFDMPAELLDNCVHWLNLRSKCLEVRRKPAIWIKRQRDWIVIVRDRQAIRGTSMLINPQSDLFHKVAQAFEHFETPKRLAVFQPLTEYGKLSIELRHLELSFFVNRRGLLECRQLKAEMDPNQDAGTWYGLQSKIVLRDVITHKRSIIVPLGNVVTADKYGMHMKISTGEAQNYGRYTVDEIMNRLSCPPEPWLLYTKALYHALTSFCLPDPLTGRTGTEEAFHILQSGAAQPWTSQRESMAPLRTLITLLPQREYYPPRVKRLQKVRWDPSLTMTIQHDGYEALVGAIFQKSSLLAEFDSSRTEGVNLAEPTHLRRRGEIRQHLYRRPNMHTSDQVTNDAICGTRDHRMKPHAGRVYEIAHLVLTGCHNIDLSSRLIPILESWKIINGFNSENISSSHIKPLANQIGDPMNEQWGDLVNFCRRAESPSSVLFRLGLLAFAPNPDMDTLRMLAAFSCIDELKRLEQPAYNSFPDFASRGKPSADLLQRLITQSCSTTKSNHDVRDRFQSLKVAVHLQSQWPVPAEELSTEGLKVNLSNLAAVLEAIVPEWERRRGNTELQGYINQVQRVLDSRRGPKIIYSPLDRSHENPTFSSPKRSREIAPVASELVAKSCNDLGDLGSSASFEDASAIEPLEKSKLCRSESSSEVEELERILSRFAKSPDDLRAQYGRDLLQSLAALKDANSVSQRDLGGHVRAPNSVVNTLELLRRTIASRARHISTALSANDGRSTWLKLGNIWPCTTPVEILELLRSTSSHQFGEGMKEALVEYGLAITNLQRLGRIRNALLRKDNRTEIEEIRNMGHQNWSPLEHPDWLLMEIESDILIRPEQVDVARAIINPASGRNSVIQMNMGKGKTSCIVPMAIAAIADGENLSRLIVPKPLLAQTAQMVQSRLGGLVGREICHVPFSRKTRMTPEVLELYSRFHHDTRRKRGLVLTSHEHVLSYQLSGWQHVADDKLETASTMTKFQGWLNDHCRDVLDECDFTLSVKTQLNYPGGSEMAVDGQPYRWEVAQELLALAAVHISSLRDEFPGSIDVRERPGSYPMAHFLKSHAEEKLGDRILGDICAGRTNFLRPANESFPNRQASIRQALSGRRPDERILTEASSAFVDPQRAAKTLLVVRGLVVNKILLFCLTRRWNVQYGLHPDRDPIAVPFEAKGTPSEQSEFGHPDVAILFTCLSFYYEGLPLGELSRSIKQVLQSDDPALQYGWWISGCSTLPESLQDWRAVNVEDAGQMEEMWKHLRFNRTVINYYMNNFVFPSYARQFETKLQASAWDIPLMSEAQPGAKTTGFSGTNDNRIMLPLTIRQDELPSLRQTNAEVLAYLLQHRNRGYQVTTDDRGKRLSEYNLLAKLYNNGIRILIDAGAYILEMDNKTLADTWLKIDHEAKAAIYFGKDSKAWVHYKGEAKSDVPLLATPFAEDLSECVVYLDEAHTRGVDLKFPSDAHGALTLAPKQTKDFTMQAAMRLRQLRSTQRVTFFAPPEVDQSIRDFCRPKDNEQLESSHVMAWLLEQTCGGIVDMQGLYVAQGLDFCHRTDAASRYGDFITNPTDRRGLLQVLKQPERQTLEQLYGHDAVTSVTSSAKAMCTPKLQEFQDQLLQSRGSTSIAQTGVFEEIEVEREREREVQNQVEQVRQVQKPPRYGALTFPGLHPTLRKFVETGILNPTSAIKKSAFAHAFSYLARTNIGKRHEVQSTGSALFVSKEFERTVDTSRQCDLIDNFLRPVEWILWSPSTRTAVIIIPEEAEMLIPLLRLRGRRSAAHLIAYAAPVTKSMMPFNEFRYYSLPQLPTNHTFPDWFRIELGMLAGRLYVGPDERELLVRYCQPGLSNNTQLTRLAGDPAEFLMEWLSLRRRTHNVTHTPMGLICTGRNPEAAHLLRASS